MISDAGAADPDVLRALFHESLGFRPTGCYNDNPIEGVLFFELDV